MLQTPQLNTLQMSEITKDDIRNKFQAKQVTTILLLHFLLLTQAVTLIYKLKHSKATVFKETIFCHEPNKVVLASDVSEAVSVSIIRGDVMSVVSSHSI
jgi:hypothetical protein